MESLLIRSLVDDPVRAAPGSEPPLSDEENRAYGDPATATVEHRHRQVVALLLDRAPISEIAMMTGYSPRWVRQIAQRYRVAGHTALEDLRHRNTGAEPLLSVEQQYELQHALQHPPPNGGEWTGPRVAGWIETKTGQRVHRQRGWEYLRRLRVASAGDGDPASQ